MEQIRNLITSVTNDSNNYDEKYMEIKFNSDDNLLLKKTLEPYDIRIFVQSVFHEG